jgi:hypothetical protein
MLYRRRSLVALNIFLALLLPFQHLDATTVRVLSLEEMVQSADRIFVGQCIAVESRRDEYNLPATYVTFQVLDPVKGYLAKTVMIKLIGSSGPGALKIADLPTFQEKETVLLFLYPTSRYGFTSPVGLQQGKWNVVKTSSGKQLLKRSFAGNPGFKGSRQTLYGLSTKDGLLDYSGFVSLLKKMAVQQ